MRSHQQDSGMAKKSSGNATSSRTRKSNKKCGASSLVSPKASSSSSSATEKPCPSAIIHPDSIKGIDDTGTFYNSHADLARTQEARRDEFYDANNKYWADSGYGGRTDDESMIGDVTGIQDSEEGLQFLDRLILANNTQQHQQVHNNDKNKKTKDDSQRPNTKRQTFDHAVDLGAGAGRVTKHVLLKRYGEVRLVEGDKYWSKRSRVYLGRKRASRCQFVHQRIDEITDSDVLNWGEPADLMWIQWTLQYLTDEDVVGCLVILAKGLREGSGVLVVKENRPFGSAREDRFQMDMPDGANARYDITRPDSHHRYLFQKAGLTVNMAEQGEETNTYALSR